MKMIWKRYKPTVGPSVLYATINGIKLGVVSCALVARGGLQGYCIRCLLPGTECVRTKQIFDTEKEAMEELEDIIVEWFDRIEGII